jgi:hypothetical protein
MNVFQTSFNGQMLERGFWLYVWRIKHKKSESEYWYVGRTGDSSSANAGSPISRLSMHLNTKQNAKGNTLIRNLEKQTIVPEDCQFKLVSVGPIFQEQATFDEHVGFRDIIAKLEAELAYALKSKGLNVLGSHPKRGNYDHELYSNLMTKISSAFGWC